MIGAVAWDIAPHGCRNISLILSETEIQSPLSKLRLPFVAKRGAVAWDVAPHGYPHKTVEYNFTKWKGANTTSASLLTSW